MHKQLALMILLFSSNQSFSKTENNEKISSSEQPKMIDLSRLIKDDPDQQITRDELKALSNELSISSSKIFEKEMKKRTKTISLAIMSFGVLMLTGTLEKISYLQPYYYGISICGGALCALSMWESLQAGVKVVKYCHKRLCKQVQSLLIEKRIDNFDNE